MALLCLLVFVGDAWRYHRGSYCGHGRCGWSEDSRGAKDIFEDKDVMLYLKAGETKATWSSKERDRVLQRAKRFVWEGTHLQRLWPDGTKKVVPTPEDRVKLIKHAHEDLGHFGVRRAYSLLQIHYWWRGMQLQVQALVARCVV
jgi:hypothetical protein